MKRWVTALEGEGRKSRRRRGKENAKDGKKEEIDKKISEGIGRRRNEEMKEEPGEGKEEEINKKIMELI